MAKPLTNEDLPWYETPEDVDAAIRAGHKKARELRLVRKLMRKKLTRTEQKYITLIYLNGMTHRAAADQCKRNASSICRGTARAIAKLRQAITPPTRRS